MRENMSLVGSLLLLCWDRLLCGTRSERLKWLLVLNLSKRGGINIIIGKRMNVN